MGHINNNFKVVSYESFLNINSFFFDMVHADLNEVQEMYRNHWSDVSFKDYDLRTAMSIMSGIVERTKSDNWNNDISNYLITSLESLKNEKVENPQGMVKLIKAASHLDLPVMSPNEMDLVTKITGTFGLVEEKDGGVYGLNFRIPNGFKDIDKDPAWKGLNVEGLKNLPMWETLDIDDLREWEPFKKLPSLYQKPSIWLCWVDYEIKGKPNIGFLEPGSGPEPQVRLIYRPEVYRSDDCT